MSSWTRKRYELWREQTSARMEKSCSVTTMERAAEKAHHAQVYGLPAVITCTNRDIICRFYAGKLTQGEPMPRLIVLRKRPTGRLTSAKGHAHTQWGRRMCSWNSRCHGLERLSIYPCLASFLYCPITRDMFEIIAIVDFMNLHVHSHPELAITPDYCDATPECPNPYWQRKCLTS
jgi:hypothetical protein